jgi:uncharacterized protein (TIGR02588 family)
MTSRPPRTTAEWVSLAVSVTVLLLLVALIVAQIPDGDRPAASEARIERIRLVADTFHVDVSVHNHGDKTAANVQVSADFSVGDEAFSGDQTIDFLSGGEDRELSFVFDRDPASGNLRVAVTGYAVP